MPTLICLGLGYSAQNFVETFGQKFERIIATMRGADRVAGGRRKDSLPKRVVVVAMCRREDLHGVTVDVDRGDIDPVDGRARHHGCLG